MVYCLNPNCAEPLNPENREQCHSCDKILNRVYRVKERYQIVEFLGQGAFGRAYKVADINFRKCPRVLKKLTIEGSESHLKKAKELFRREAEKLDELKHEQIPRIYDHFEEGNALYLVEQYIEGKTLDKELAEKGAWEERQVVNLLEQMLPVLEYLHEKGLLHRDIKPDNIIRQDSDGKLFLIDFGGVKEVATTKKTILSILYTPGYAANEQMRGLPERTSDLYSLAVTAVRMLTGCLPAGTSSQDEIYNAAEDEWVWREKLEAQGRKISTELEGILTKMLARLARNRYQSAGEVREALEKIRTSKGAQAGEKSEKGAVGTQRVGGGLISRQRFVQVVGWGGVGAIVTIVVDNLIGQRQNNLATKEPSKLPPPVSGESASPLVLKSYSFETVTLDNRGQIIRREQKQAKYYTEDLGNGVMLEMVYIPGGSFMMGAAPNEKGADEDEHPQHLVNLPAFYMSKYPITQEQWLAILKKNPAYFQGKGLPVERVSWYDSMEFCKELSARTDRTCTLPSEAQWEYSCRAGTTTPFYFGETLTTEVANYNGNYTYAQEAPGEYREKTTPVGIFPPNAFGLYDLHGNVWEWCLDDYHENYVGAPVDGSPWGYGSEKDTSRKIIRGGSWYYDPVYCRSAIRNRSLPDLGYDSLGVRVVCASA